MPLRAALALLLASSLAPTPPVAASCWVPPVDAPVVDPFRLPACVWCPGNRGLEYGAAPGQAVRAVEAGVVSFAGSVAGTSYVVVQVADGRRVTYGNLVVDASAWHVGDRVRAGQVVGTAAGAVLLTVRAVDGTYVDPAPLLGDVVRPPRLVPIDGSPTRPAPTARLRCGSGR